MPVRKEYTDKDEDFLAHYIAKYNPQVEGRQGNLLYQRLCENAEGKWPWARHHSWQSWREHYKNNRARLDKKINKYIKKYHQNQQPSAQSAVTPASSQGQSSGRVPYTREDDNHIAEYLASVHQSYGSAKGEKLWRALVEEAEAFPWVNRHSWSSWRERYINNQEYFDWAARRLRSGEDNDSEVEGPPRPKTVEAHRVHKPQKNSQRISRPWVLQRSHGVTRDRADAGDSRGEASRRDVPMSKGKRPRASEVDAPQSERPVKKTRVQVEDAPEDEQHIAGPSGRAQTVMQEREDAQQDAANDPEVLGDPVQLDEAENGDHAGSPNVSASENVGDENDQLSGDDGEEPSGPAGSDDYQNELFGSPHLLIPDAESAEPDVVHDDMSALSDEEQEQEELDELLGDEGQDGQDADVDTHAEDEIDVDGDSEWQAEQDEDGDGAVERPGHMDQSPEQDDETASREDTAAAPGPEPSDDPPPHHPASCTKAHIPPARKHNLRIRETEAPLATPELSPTQEAAARHRYNQRESLGQMPSFVPRRHAKRIKRPQDEEFFGTPPRLAVDDEETGLGEEDEGKEPSSPMTEAEARHHHHQQHANQAQEQRKVQPRQPPRLEEGAFNKAFTDSRGRSRMSPKGKQRRPSGVDFEDEDEDVEEAPAAGPGEPEFEDEQADTLPQWPPPRKANKEKAEGKAPAGFSTPSPTRTPRGKGKERERTVTTKEILSVRTIRTVERRVARPAKGTPYPRGALLAQAAADAEDDEQMDGLDSSPSPAHGSAHVSSPPGADMDVDEEVAEGEDVAASWPTQSQHHAFSQAPHPFSQHIHDPASSVRPSTTQAGAPLSKDDLSRFQRLLHPQPQSQATSTKTCATSKAQGQAQRPKAVPLSGTDRTRLENILRMDGRRAFPEPSKHDRPSLEKQKETQPSASRVSVSAESAMDVEEENAEVPVYSRSATSPLASKSDLRARDIVPPPASDDILAASGRRVDKGKARADAQASDRHSRRYTVGGHAAKDVFYGPEERTSLPAQKQPPRQSLPARFSIGNDSFLANRTALSLALHPPNPRPPSIASTTALSRSVSPGKPASSPNTSLADTLPSHELEMVKELGMNTALHIMARNHGFSEDTVRELYMRTRSLEVTDNILREMREVANERASEALSVLLSTTEDAAQDEPGADEEVEDRTGEEAEVEQELTQPQGTNWLRDGASFDLADEAPLAESSRIDASHLPGNNSRSDPRKRQFRIQRLPGERDSSVDTGYSPPKRTKAAEYLKRERESIGRPQKDSGGVEAQAMEADASGASASRTSRQGDVAFGQLVRMDSDEWSRLEEKHGKGAAKVLAGKALAKLLGR
ncbi:hypothetical protein BV20DRAFT_962879 [Pilatotrama ljubarskyi]|nr:hypothetical protein BV20DRAFT_962879 [Pilatotrama ljubarskyi]